jgi:predicted TIM-barrel fold metal-dependent hydrolase
MPLIDFRARPNTRENMALYTRPQHTFMWKRWGCPPPDPVPLEQWVRALDNNGIDTAVITGRQLTENGKLIFGLANDYIHDCVAAYPERLIGIAGIDMNLGAGAVPEIERSVRDLGLKGICVDAGRSRLMPGDREIYPIYEKAAELAIPVVVTIGPFAGRMHDPYLYDTATADFPTLNFVFSHAVFPQTDGWMALAYRRPNVYIEPSIYWTMPGTEAMFAAANGELQDQIVYASAFPFAGLDSMTKLHGRFDWSEGCWEKFTYLNAARLLGL